jgi:hypothetical protein
MRGRKMATEWLSSYVTHLKSLKLGQLVEEMVDLKLEMRFADSEEDLSSKAERIVKLETLRNEISNRETDRKDISPSPVRKVTSLKGFI